MTIPEGWYRDPANPDSLRYWDGNSWTTGPPPGQTPQPETPTPAAPPVQPPPIAPPPPAAALPRQEAATAKPGNGRLRLVLVGLLAVVVVAGVSVVTYQALSGANGDDSSTAPVRAKSTTATTPTGEATLEPTSQAPSPSPTETPTVSPAADLETYEDSSLWSMDCSQAADPSTVEVHHVAKGDVNSDGLEDVIIAASCTTTTSAWPDEVRIFNGEGEESWGGIPLLASDAYDGSPRVSSLSVDGDRVTVTGKLLAKTDPLCCPSIKFTDVIGFGGEEWTVLSHQVNDPESKDAPGYGKVKLGMSEDQLVATDEVTEVTRGGGFITYTLNAGGQVCYSTAKGAAMVITFGPTMATSAGIKIGSTEAGLHGAYPAATQDVHGYWVAPLRDNVQYQFGITDSRVSEIYLARRDQDCFG